ncbi:hypothetical protein [Bordetella sp. 15P40C-2]|uniref:hypothetical protein n=1 Tax=Bordetella sp. 15P40C-2 TaxID=2572246 RepID=UPI001325F50C|nr:hypothetical protein [Bordetella sp. 15P40C-2]MVW71001.1 hypothetical protein [Bordetella sp. 15P40C-2]
MRELALSTMPAVSGGLDSTTGAAMIAGTLSRALAYTVTSSVTGGSCTLEGLKPSWTKGWIVPGIADVFFDSDTYESRLPVAFLYGTLAGFTDALEQRAQAATVAKRD